MDATPFISDGRAAVSYQELREAIPVWDKWLRQQGSSREDCLALYLRGDVESAAALLALLFLRQSACLSRQPVTSMASDESPGTAPRFCHATLIKRQIGTGADPSPADPDGFCLVHSNEHAVTRHKAEPAYVYVPTSGTTGTPKIAAYEHDRLISNAGNCVTRFQLSPADRVLIPVPLAHMYGLGAAFLPAFLAGASVRLISEANLLNYLQAEEEFEPTVTYLTPNFCYLLVKGRKKARKYRLTILAGDSVPEQLFTSYEQQYGCTVNLYGSTELGAIAAGGPGEPFDARRDTAGKLMPGVRLANINTAGQAESRAQDELSPLCFEHPHGCSGYADADGKPEKPEWLFDGRYYATQDMGRADADGRLQLLGRVADSVKRDGLLVAFADIESALQKLVVIERALVVPGGMTPRGRELIAVCVSASGSPVNAEAMRRLALGVLPGYAAPDRFVFVNELPLTATYKPDRSAAAYMVAQ